MQNQILVFLKKIIYNLGIFFQIGIFFFSCSRPPSFERYTFKPGDNPGIVQKNMNELDEESENIFKLHMKNANVYIMKTWKVIELDSVIAGYGALFNANRNLIKKDSFRIPIKDIALIETNEQNTNPSLVALTLVTAASLALTVYCFYNYKACFGSCPTFYVWNGTEMQLQAEGFSGAVAPSLEEKDIDALYFAKLDNGNLKVKLTNEALETHVIRFADILAVPKQNNERVFAANNGKFYSSPDIIPPSSVMASEGECKEKLISIDANERFSLADSNDLSAKEVIELSFGNLTHGSKGLVLAFRQTLMTTFLYYSALSYMGHSAGEYLAMLERSEGDFMRNVYGLKDILGGIKVYVQNESGGWDYIDEFFELGPISTDVQMLPLTSLINNDCKIRLEMTNGLWRIDYAALVSNYYEVKPIRIQPSYIIRENTHDSIALEKLTDEAKQLATLPGDEYFINYTIPDKSQSYEFFLESKGYYIEWMRKEWLNGENPVLLSELFFNPHQYFKDVAPEFKQLEPKMEEAFWNSRYVRK